jgi:hypothetical protein
VLRLADDSDAYHGTNGVQEDFYHPDHFWNLLFPLLARIIRFFLWLNVLGCFWLACVLNLRAAYAIAYPPEKTARTRVWALHRRA